MRSSVTVVIVLALLSPGCGSSGPSPTVAPPAPEDPPARQQEDAGTEPPPLLWEMGEPTTSVVDVRVNGLSGLASSAGVLWAIAERGSAAVRIALRPDGSVRSAKVIRIQALPRGYDLESVAVARRSELLLGTETSGDTWKSEGQELAKIFMVRRRGRRFRAMAAIVLPFSLWGVTPEENQGIEGLCLAGGNLIAGIETVAVRNGARHAPLAARRYPGDDQPWKPFFLELSSEEGKLSALDCQVVNDTIELIAVERHFGVMRILRAELPRDPAAIPDVVTPRIAADLTSLIEAEDLNVEGITTTGDGAVALVVDNQYHRVTGKNQLIVFPEIERSGASRKAAGETPTAPE